MLKFEFNRANATFYQIIAGLTGVTLILVGCIIILAPFFPAMLLATIFALATWPAFDWLHKKLKLRTALAAGLMTALLALSFVMPLIIIGTSIVDNYDRVYETVQSTLNADPVETAQHIKGVPVVGDSLEKLWMLAMTDREALSERLKEYSGEMTKRLLPLGKAIGQGLFDVTLGVIIAYFLFRYGTVVAARVSTLIQKFGGKHGQRLLQVSTNTLTGVVYGLLGTALAQGAFAAIGFWIAEVPGATFLGLLTFFLSLIPIGPPMVWIPAVLWLLSEGETFWAIFLGLWGVVVIGSIDNVLKPYFISRGSNLPLLLVLLGILGGVVAFGFIGVFIGPTLLALAYSLIMEWSTVRAAYSTPFEEQEQIQEQEQ